MSRSRSIARTPAAFSLRLLAACVVAVLTIHPADAAVRSVSPSGTGRDGFTTMPALDTGVAFTNLLADRSAAANQVLQNGSGVALGDVDGDGRCDIYLCNLEGPNALYRNLGNWRFTNITTQAGIACDGDLSTGAVLADLDGDQDLDLLVNSVGGGTRCFFNDGAARFTESNSGLHRRFGAMSMALGDIDGDGDLDLYVANYRTNTVRSTGIQVLNVNGRRMVRPEDRDQLEFTAEGRLQEYGERDALYLNDGRGGFTPAPWTDGRFMDEDGRRLTDAPRDWGLSVMLRDLNGDGAPDLYVCNDFFTPDRIWINDGRGNFRALPRPALRHTSTFSMGADFADINRDGHDDFLVLDMLSRDHARRMRQRGMSGESASSASSIDERLQAEHNTLFLNRGNGTYAEIAMLAGVHASEWSWGVAFLDVDLDGYEDILITNGHDFDTQDADTGSRLDQLGPRAGKPGETLLHYPRLFTANVAFRNRGDVTFEETGARWGFNSVGVSHGLALGDLDDDGDLDVVLNNLNAAATLLRNDSPAPRIGIRLKGRGANSRGIGSSIRLEGARVAQSQQMIAGGRYLSSDDAMRVFATGGDDKPLQVTVTWRNRSRSVVTNAQPNHVYEIEEPSAPTAPAGMPSSPAPLFADASPQLAHTHRDEPFDDFARQSLLPRRLSQLGPGLTWTDVDEDGREDLIVGTGRGGSIAVLRQTGSGKFVAATNSPIASMTGDDFTQVLTTGVRSNGFAYWTAATGYETAALPTLSGFRDLNTAAAISIGQLGGSPGAMATADVDGDGEVDLFVAGRIIAGRYPEAGPSRLFRVRNGLPAPAQEWTDLGMVTSATFSDLTGDGLPELIIATEWGPLKLFRNEGGKFVPGDPVIETSSATNQSARAALSTLTGWWTSVTTADFDNDGRLDIVAGNWGRNHAQKEHLRDGLRLHFGDFAGRGSMEAIEAYHDPARNQTVPARSFDALAQAMPFILERIPNYRSFGEASIEKIFGDRLRAGRELRVTWLDSTVFLNRGETFKAVPLPVEAQFAPAFGIGAADFDGDGSVDLALAQNFFGVNAESSRHDAGCGLLLIGNGTGSFRPLPPAESGVVVHGEQRGLAVADFDQDGRADFAIAQNSGPTRLFHNRRATPGVRWRLRGPTGNPNAIGAILTAKLANGRVWAREIKAGTGCFSQDSAVQLLPKLPTDASVILHWPGGQQTTVRIPRSATELEVDSTGATRVLR